MAVTTKKTFAATTNGTTTTFGPIGIELNNQDDLDVYITLSGGNRILQLKQSSASTAGSSHPQVSDTTGLYFPSVASGTSLTNYTISADNNNIIFNSALPSGAIVSCERRTRDGSGDYTSFSGGSTIRATDLNSAFDEARMTAVEARNKAFDLQGTYDHYGTGNITVKEDKVIKFEGATDDAYETSLTVTDPTADRTITLPNVTGTVVTTGDTGTVTSTMLASGTVATADIAADAITGAKIADDSIDSEHYVDGSIDTAHIADSQVTTAKIGADAVTGAKIADDAIDSEHYVDGSIDTAHLAADAVTGAKIADDALDSEHYTDGSIDTAHLAADVVTGAKIADDAIDSEHYTDGSIDTAHIADDQVTLAKMAGLARGKIIYGDSSGNPAALAIGTSGKVLSSDGTDVSWDTVSGGKCLQVVSTTTTGKVSESISAGSTGSTEFLSASMTAASGSNKILVTGVIQLAASTAEAACATLYIGGSVSAYRGDADGSSRQRVTSRMKTDGTANEVNLAFNYLVSSPSTSSTAYSIRCSHGHSGTQTVYMNHNSAEGDEVYDTRTASTITLMEISA